MKNLVTSSYFRIVLLALVVATLGLLLKKYSSTREKFNALEDGPQTRCAGCQIEKNDDDRAIACTQKTTDGTTQGCTGFKGFRCGVCDEYYKDKTDKGNWIIDNDTDYNEQVRECSKERIGGTAEADDGCPATMQPPESGNTGTTNQESESSNESTSAETTTVSSFSQSLINFKNVLNQKLGGDPVSISSNNVNSTSDIVNKLEELLQESTIEEVNSFKNFSYNNGITTPLPLDPGFEPLTGGNTLAEYSDYQRFL